jgi:hypothetical protein
LVRGVVGLAGHAGRGDEMPALGSKILCRTELRLDRADNGLSDLVSELWTEVEDQRAGHEFRIASKVD